MKNPRAGITMFEFTECIDIGRSPGDVWPAIADVESWWLPSNPEHIRIEVGERPLRQGSEVCFEEKVAGIRGYAQGRITRVVPGENITWEGRARYRYWGLRFQIAEGVAWTVEASSAGTRLCATVWAVFPATWFGRFLEMYTKYVVNVVDKDRAHARQELQWLKQHLEEEAP
jgi:hypothetical protein